MMSQNTRRRLTWLSPARQRTRFCRCLMARSFRCNIFWFLSVASVDQIIFRDGTSSTTMFLKGTPSISVDSFGFLVSEFEFNTLSGPVAHSFYAKSGDKNLTNFALNNADKFLDELQSYISYSHGLAKLVHVAIPDIIDGRQNYEMLKFRPLFFNK